MQSDLSTLFAQKNALEKELLVRNQYARNCLSDYRFASIPTPAHRELMEEKSRLLDEVLLKIISLQEKAEVPLALPRRLRKENIFLWGGPTPHWGGSMDPATSVRGAEYFSLENVVYVYGPLDQNTMEIHKNCKRLICQVTSTARIAGAQNMSDAECAEHLSKLSLQYPNIIGGIADDLILYLGRNYSVKDIKAIYEGLKKHNSALDLYGVVYGRELDNSNIPLAAPYIDAVNLWLDWKSQIAELDYLIEKCRVRFPGKKIMLGIFMQDINLTDLEYDDRVLISYLQRAERAFQKGKIEDIVILGDREITKYPRLAESLRTFLQEHF